MFRQLVYYLFMEKVFVLAILVTVLFCISKFVESRYLNDDDKPIKEIVRDALIVLVCSMTGAFILFNAQDYISDFFNVVTETKVLNSASTQIFTDAPGF